MLCFVFSSFVWLDFTVYVNDVHLHSLLSTEKTLNFTFPEVSFIQVLTFLLSFLETFNMVFRGAH